MGWAVLIVVGCVVGALGVHEVRTGQATFPRFGSDRDAVVRRDGWFLVGSGAVVLLIALAALLDFPDWLLLALVLAAVAAMVAGLVTHEPGETPGEPTDPPPDPDGV